MTVRVNRLAGIKPGFFFVFKNCELRHIHIKQTLAL